MRSQTHQFESSSSAQTLAEALSEYYGANPHLKRGEALSSEAREFFQAHDVVHIVYGCNTSMPDEAIVKISSLFGSSAGLSVLHGYRLYESLDIYRRLPLASTLTALVLSPYLVVRTIWRCTRQTAKWPWAGLREIPANAARRDS